MPILKHNSYGKSGVRLTRVTRTETGHYLTEMTVAIQLEGDFVASYTDGDNGLVVATDTMKNTVYALARSHPVDSGESFGSHLAEHFLKSYPQVSSVRVAIEEDQWQRMLVEGEPHPTTFIGGSREKRTAKVFWKRGEARPEIKSGLKDCLVLKTTDSAFSGFPRDRFTTLPETEDRIMATSIEAEWGYGDDWPDWTPAFLSVREAMLNIFARHFSRSVQETLQLMGEAALEACPEMTEISLQLPNSHRLLINLEPMGLDNPNEIFVPTNEPYGLITGILRRD